MIFYILIILPYICHTTHTTIFKPQARGGSLFANSLSTERKQLHTILKYPLDKTSELNAKSSNYEGVWYPPIDHSNYSVGYFKQRWFRNNVYAASNVAILYIAGEGEVTGSMTGSPLLLAQNLSAPIITVEHRYYGHSLPFPLEMKEKLRYLTVEQAMADFAAFTYWYNRHVAKSRLRWIVVGGSYSGALSAYLRTDYPDIFEASWSSSGVVHALFDYYEFDYHNKKVLPPQCASAVHNALMSASYLWDQNSSGKKQVQDIFHIPNYFEKLDALWMLSDGSAMSIQYGGKETLCNIMMQPVYDTVPGAISIKLMQLLHQAIVELMGPNFTQTCSYSTNCMTDVSKSHLWGSGVAWLYQTCSELGFWQHGYPGSIRPIELTTEYFMDQCKKVFNVDIFPDTFSFNLRHGGSNPTRLGATKVIALQGSDDPWITAGVQRSLSSSYVEVTATCDGCGHCGDLSVSNNTAIVHQQQVIFNLINKWLFLS